MIGVYKILSPSGKVYIGQSRNIEKRWVRHREARKFKTSKLHSSLKKYGWRAHIFKIVSELPIDVSQDVINKYEQIYLDFYRDAGFLMLNIKEAGSMGLFSDESKLKMSISHKEREPWNKGKKGSQVAWNKGKSICRKTYTFLHNGSVVVCSNLKEYCKSNGLDYFIMLSLHNKKGFYANKKYKGYEKQ